MVGMRHTERSQERQGLANNVFLYLVACIRTYVFLLPGLSLARFVDMVIEPHKLTALAHA